MIRLQPLPDELDRSYLGALMRFNGWDDESVAVRKMATWNGTEHVARRLNPTLQVLSQVAGMSLVDFTREHSTLASRRSLASRKIDADHGCPSNLDLVGVSGLRLARPGAYLCKDCVWDDIALHGRSYWRRSHQAPGQYWCPKHLGPLSVVTDVREFFKAPSNVVDQAKEFSRTWTDELQQHPVVQRFLEIGERLGERPRPLHASVARDVLRAAARRVGLQLHEPKAKSVACQPLLSDEMLKEYPRGWIQQVVPALDDKEQRRYVHSVDGVLWSGTLAASVSVYVAALALLHDSAATAIAALNEAQQALASAAIRRRQTTVDVDPKALYVAAGGSHHFIRRDRQDDWYPITRSLIASGLPNLPKGASSSVRKSVLAFLVEGKSLEECLRVSGECRQEFEAVLRAACEPLAAAFKQMNPERIDEAPKWRRHKAALGSLEALGAYGAIGDSTAQPVARQSAVRSARPVVSCDKSGAPRKAASTSC